MAKIYEINSLQALTFIHITTVLKKWKNIIDVKIKIEFGGSKSQITTYYNNRDGYRI